MTSGKVALMALSYSPKLLPGQGMYECLWWMRCKLFGRKSYHGIRMGPVRQRRLAKQKNSRNKKLEDTRFLETVGGSQSDCAIDRSESVNKSKCERSSKWQINTHRDIPPLLTGHPPTSLTVSAGSNFFPIKLPQAQGFPWAGSLPFYNNTYFILP